MKTITVEQLQNYLLERFSIEEIEAWDSEARMLFVCAAIDALIEA